MLKRQEETRQAAIGIVMGGKFCLERWGSERREGDETWPLASGGALLTSGSGLVTIDRRSGGRDQEYCTLIEIAGAVMKRVGFLTAALVAGLTCGLILAACSKPADDEIQAAEEALKNAQSAGADVSSPRLYEKARDLLTEAKRANESGNYSEARKKAEFAMMRAEQAGKNAEKLGGKPHERRRGGGGGAEGGEGGE